MHTSSKTNAREYATQKFQTLATTVWKLCQFCKSSMRWRHTDKLKSPESLIDMRYFCNFSFFLLGIRPNSRLFAERTRRGDGRWSRPLKSAQERCYSTGNSSSANRILSPRRKKTPDRNPETKNELIYVYCGTLQDDGKHNTN